MALVRLIPVIILIGCAYQAYKNAKNTEERKKVNRNIGTIVGVWIALLLLISIPILFIIILNKVQGY
ncbi:hypothetical protein [Alkaliphilus metalliredigens]|uniref:hypothetical protein n=1 Tax=Alkaliphilus metalliredigens TaxID=208226 RepID=UPI0005A259B9|nr:hypothetical protein [Alkaliphilus metalliredigens]